MFIFKKFKNARGTKRDGGGTDTIRRESGKYTVTEALRRSSVNKVKKRSQQNQEMHKGQRQWAEKTSDDSPTRSMPVTIHTQISV